MSNEPNIPEEQPPEEPAALKEWLSRMMILINGALDNARNIPVAGSLPSYIFDGLVSFFSSPINPEVEYPGPWVVVDGVWRPMVGMYFRPDYSAGDDSYPQDVVNDDGYLMCCNKATNDPAAPSRIGDPYNIYSGTMGSDSVVTNQFMSGNRYFATRAGYLTGYRVHVVEGYHYITYLVKDPEGAPVAVQIADFIARTTGWVEYNVDDIILTEGFSIDFVLLVNEPNPTPTITTISYNYLTPNLPGTPADGEIIHANQLLGVISISKIDDNGADQSTFLATLSVGDIVSRNSISWSIQSITDQGTYIDLGVAPTLQDSPDGVADINFETTVPTPITFAEDIDYWIPKSNVQGFRSDNGSYLDIVLDQTAYGIDIQVQEVSTSPDWDVISLQSGSAAGASNKPYIQVEIPETILLESSPETTLAEIPMEGEQSGWWRFGFDLAWYITGTGGTSHRAIFRFYFVLDGVATLRFTYAREPKDVNEIDWASKGTPTDYEQSYDTLRVTVEQSDGASNPELVVQQGFAWMQKL